MLIISNVTQSYTLKNNWCNKQKHVQDAMKSTYIYVCYTVTLVTQYITSRAQIKFKIHPLENLNF